MLIPRHQQHEKARCRLHIQVTEATYWRLYNHYRFEPRGEINIKGYPNTTVYHLLGKLEPEKAVNPAIEAIPRLDVRPSLA